MIAAVVVAIIHRWVPNSTWLLIHLVLLGALTHSALVWSEHFAHTLLRTPPDDAAKHRQAGRILLLAFGSLLVFIGVPADIWPLVVVGATLVAAAVLWHGVHLALTMRKALPSRFRIVTRTYIAAACWLPVGASFGAALAFGLSEQVHGRFLIAHVAANVLGWIGLTVTGTLVTFWPTMLRARMDDRAERFARQALPVQLVGIGLLVIGAGFGWRPVALVGLVVYVAGLVWWGRALIAPLQVKGLREFAPASVLAALIWGGIGLAWLGWLLATTPSWGDLGNTIPTVGSLFAAGFAAQLLLGALSYLIPAVMGGGPASVRAAKTWFDRWAALRLIVANGGIALFLAPSPHWVKVTTGVAALAALASFLPLMVRGVLAGLKAKRAAQAGEPLPETTERATFGAAQIIAGFTALALTVALGVGIDSAAGSQGGSVGVQPTGHTTRVEVSAKGMRFSPSSVAVPAGNRLVVVLRNEDPTTAHDLIIGNATTPRLQPGESIELDAGIMTASTQGYCSVAGHRQAGMVFDVVVEGATTGNEHAQHGATASPGGASIGPNPADTLGTTIDPVLPPLTDERVHKLTFTVTEVPLEVAPGLWQTRWTFNGGSVGPTLHGRVGDVFELTLVNDGTIGHSIDFHAGALAPDRPMRTIAPGESLVYRFTAGRAGIWMYHCGTMPMTSHIAAGMTGAVVIEPDGLPEVDHSYVLVQSELYLANAARDSSQAKELDAAKIADERPDRVVFNGIANQYDLSPFNVKTGERVRFWVLDAGPNRPLSFHIVGGQFDTVWTEGTYTLQGGKAALGGTDGGAQVLPLLPAQGGFVELTFPEAGHYSVVNHVMIDAERGAHGIVEVTER